MIKKCVDVKSHHGEYYGIFDTGSVVGHDALDTV